MSDTTVPRRATLAQVAELAGVSLKTASRALGGEPYVSERTRAQVLTAARSLGYQRNAAASLLASGRLSESVGLIAGDFTNPFYSAVAEGLENAIRERGFHLTVASSRESAEREWELARTLADAQTKAIVVVSAMTDHSPYETLQARGVPVVFVDRAAEGADSVVLDNRGGGRAAARHLLAAGHRRIAFIGDYEWLPTHRDRVAGMAEVLDDAGIAGWRELVRTGAHDAATARRCAAELLAEPDPPTAVIAGNNRVLLGLVEELAARPEARPAVLGFDDVEWARVLGISVVAHDPADIGRHAARLALARLVDRGGPAQSVVLPLTLVERGSAERPPA